MINKSYIFNVDNYLAAVEEGESFYVVKALHEVPEERLTKVGFTQQEVGTTILPAICGPKSRFNVNGSYILRRDLPKETRIREWYRMDWNGDWDYVDVVYQRYQREPIPAPEIELTILEKDGNKYIVSPLLINNEQNRKKIKQTINLFLELFHNCNLFKEGLIPIFHPCNIKKVNWLIFPPGEQPWERTKEIIKFSNTSKTKANAQRSTYEHITQYKPESVVVGLAGFHGYIAYLFPEKELALLEHMQNGNATYVFQTSNWKMFSQLTKSEIINNALMKERIVHKSDWKANISRILS